MSSAFFPLVILIATALIGYIIGSISFAVIVSKVMGLEDPRRYGSGNPGATNVLRSGSKKAAALTLLGDAFKGWFVVVLAQHLTTLWSLPPHWPQWIVAVAAVAVFIGHAYSFMLGFKGGKGVATSLGILLALDPLLGLACLLTWLLVAFSFRYSSLAALCSALLAPVYYLLIALGNGRFSLAWCCAIIIIAAWLIVKHKRNINNLWYGKESKIGSKH